MNKSKIRVAIVTEDARPAGPQIRITRVAKRIYNYNTNVSVVHPKNEHKSISNNLSNARIDRHEVEITRPTMKSLPFIRYVLSFSIDVFRLIRVLKSIKPDVVHCNGPHQIKGLIAAKALGLPKVWHINDTRTTYLVKNAFALLKNTLTDGFIASSNKTIEEYNLMSTGKPTTLIRPPVNTDEYNPQNISQDKNIVDSDGLSVVTVCNVTPIKNIEMFIRVAEAINQKIENITFYVVGPIYNSKNIYFRKVRKMSREARADIIFSGYREDVRPALKAADLFLCTSYHESGPLSVFEAMSMKIPVVSTDVGDLRDIISEDEKACFLVDDVESMCHYACKILTDSKFSIRCGEAGRRVAIDQLSLENAAKRHRAAYETSIDSYYA
jgi:glycosyltransferase involved in cell wall biosynthesis